MDNENSKDFPQDDSWLDEILPPPELDTEIGPDEHAVHAAGLKHPDDVVLDQIIQETEGWEEPPAAPAEEPFRDQEYRDTFGDADDFAAAFDEIVMENAQGASHSGPAYTPPTPSEPEEAPDDEEPEDEEPEPPVRKGRPRRKKGYGLLGIPHILATLVWLGLAVAIGIYLGRLVWLCAADVLAFGKPDQAVTVTITASDTMDTIAEKLQRAGLIEYPSLFKMFADLKDAEEEIVPGTYTMNTRYDYNALLNVMSPWEGGLKTIDLTFAEGLTCSQIFNLLEENGVCTVAELEDYAANGELGDYWFLEGVERGSKYCLEGYLFPDTYQFYLDDEPRHVLEKFLDGFDYRYTDIMRERIDTLNERFRAVLSSRGYDESYIQEHLFTIREVVIVASMIERESGGSDENYTISSVIFNRLSNPGNFPYLNIDATIVYALGGNVEKLTEEDLQIDSPYNSYTRPGLIPGPICNPGRDCLNAALMPEETNYYFYALVPDTKEHRFFSSSSEFDSFLASIRN